MFFSGPTDISFIDPVVIGRNVFSVIDNFVSGITGYIQNVLCAILDVTLDTLKGTVSTMLFNPCLICLSNHNCSLLTVVFTNNISLIVMTYLLIRYPACCGIQSHLSAEENSRSHHRRDKHAYKLCLHNTDWQRRSVCLSDDISFL